MKRILLTGAAGVVGTALRPLLSERYANVLLTDISDITEVAENESFEKGDIADLPFVRSLATRVDGIVHLAGMVGPDYSWDEVLQPNIVGTFNVYEAARAAGVKNVVYASSHHSVGFIRRGEKIDETTAQRPDSYYGVSKAFGESLGVFFADKFGLNVLAIRIGFVGDQVIDERRLHTWVSACDLAQLIEIGLATEDLGYELVYGVSENPESFFDNSNAARLGYSPNDNSVNVVADSSILEKRPDPQTIEGSVVGGRFAAAGFQGNTRRITG